MENQNIENGMKDKNEKTFAEYKNEKNITEFMKDFISRYEQCEYMPEPVKFEKRQDDYITLVLREDPLDPESPVLSIRVVDLTVPGRCEETRKKYEADILRQEDATRNRIKGRTKTEKALIEKAIKKANSDCGLSSVNSHSNKQKKQENNAKRASIKETVEPQTKTTKVEPQTKTTERTR